MAVWLKCKIGVKELKNLNLVGMIMSHGDGQAECGPSPLCSGSHGGLLSRAVV